MPRSKPMLIAPLIPLLAILGIFGVDFLFKSRYLVEFIIVWCALLAALTVYIFRQVLAARRRKR